MPSTALTLARRTVVTTVMIYDTDRSHMLLLYVPGRGWSVPCDVVPEGWTPFQAASVVASQLTGQLVEAAPAPVAVKAHPASPSMVSFTFIGQADMFQQLPMQNECVPAWFPMSCLPSGILPEGWETLPEDLALLAA